MYVRIEHYVGLMTLWRNFNGDMQPMRMENVKRITTREYRKMAMQEGFQVPEWLENAAHQCVADVGVDNVRLLIQALTIIAEGREARLSGK